MPACRRAAGVWAAAVWGTAAWATVAWATVAWATVGVARAEEVGSEEAGSEEAGSEEAEPAAIELPEIHPRRAPAPRYATGAWRAQSPVGPPAVAGRFALVADPDGLLIGETTLRGQAAWPAFGVSAELAAVGGVSESWSSAGLGNLVLDARGIWGRRLTHTFGVRGSLAAGDRGGVEGSVAYWGSVPAATVPMWGVSLVTGGATERWVWEMHLGLHLDGFRYPGYADGILDLGASLATVQPLGRGWEGVGELEGMVGPSPVHLRVLARRRYGAATFDLGIALPVVAMIQDPTLQIVGGVRWGSAAR